MESQYGDDDVEAQRMDNFDIELKLLLDAIYLKYQHDFRHYSLPSLRRRLTQALVEFGHPTLSQLQDRILRHEDEFTRLFQYLTVQVSEMFGIPPISRRCASRCCRCSAPILPSRCGWRDAAMARNSGR